MLHHYSIAFLGFVCVLALLLVYIVQTYFLKEVSTPIDPTPKELACYLENYPDLQEQFKGDINKAREHWYAKGALEGRVPHCPRTDGLTPAPLTDEQARQYLNTYLDLQRMYGNTNVEAAKKHWVDIGYLEGRVVPQAWTSDMPSRIYLLSGQSNKRCGVDTTGRLACGNRMDVFQLKNIGDDRLTLQTGGKFCGDHNQQVVCTQPSVGPNETFTYQKVGQTKLTLRSGVSNLYCAENDMGQVVCDRSRPDHFQYYRIPPERGVESNVNTRTKPYPPSLPTPPPPRRPMPVVTPALPEPELPDVAEQVNRLWSSIPTTNTTNNKSPSTTNAIQPRPQRFGDRFWSFFRF